MSIEDHIKCHINQVAINTVSVSTGIFEAYKVKLESGKSIFIKYQHNSNNQLINEATELNLLAKSINTPSILGCCDQCLILEWIEESYNKNSHLQAGLSLAKLHKNTAKYFGFNFDNKIGQTDQVNGVGERITDWSEFFWQYRLLYQIELAHNNKLINHDDYQRSLTIKGILQKLINISITPSLLHGDLWSGNIISSNNGPYFIDSASYYGHREIDFALTFMFGGFSEEFYSAYNDSYPLDEGFESRKPLYMLYHYLNHLNIFGKTYHSGVMNCIDQLKSNC